MDRTDEQIQDDVEAELRWTPELDAAAIGVTVRDGVVSVYGDVEDYPERIAADRAARRVRGVAAVADELRIRPMGAGAPDDLSIAQAIEHDLAWSSVVPPGVQATVHDGVVTLQGEVMWHDQREAAGRLAARVRGVREVRNRVVLSLRASSRETTEQIRHALRRVHPADPETVRVTAAGTRVVLTGAVRTDSERRRVITAAWHSPNVTAVEDRLTVTGGV